MRTVIQAIDAFPALVKSFSKLLIWNSSLWLTEISAIVGVRYLFTLSLWSYHTLRKIMQEASSVSVACAYLCLLCTLDSTDWALWWLICQIIQFMWFDGFIFHHLALNVTGSSRVVCVIIGDKISELLEAKNLHIIKESWLYFFLPSNSFERSLLTLLLRPLFRVIAWLWNRRCNVPTRVLFFYSLFADSSLARASVGDCELPQMVS